MFICPPDSMQALQQLSQLHPGCLKDGLKEASRPWRQGFCPQLKSAQYKLPWRGLELAWVPIQ